jgi:phosphoribosylformimino-5-aminoimidazole carboxamide ribotide isomerase
MRIIPVMDLQNGVVVRGIAGRRHAYRPIISQLTGSCRPADVAQAFRDHFGVTELYLADLDAIAGGGPALGTYSILRNLGFRLHVDAGVRHAKGARPLAAAGAQGIVAGLETIVGPEVLGELCREYGSARILFSLDLKEGRPLGNPSAWGTIETWPIVEQAVEGGATRIIILDLARVGVDTGTGTEELCARLAQEFPAVETIAGGGVRDESDLERLRRCGVKAVLVASALHDGRLRREHLEKLSSPGEC